jgi:hypothetical protein
VKPSPRLARPTSDLSESVQHRLNMYALAASAAGVGMLALAPPAEAKIVYTATNKKFVNHSFAVDLNHDGKTDFVFQFRYGTDHYLSVAGAQKGNAAVTGGQQMIRGVARAVAAVLPKGAVIGAGDKFVGAPQVLGAVYYNSDGGQTYFYGKWTNAGTLYLGVQFYFSGQKHYGWVRLNITIPNGSGNLQYPPITAQLTGYAYETVAGRSIKAGQTTEPNNSAVTSDSLRPDDPGPSLTNPTPDQQPATLGSLAMGSPALSIWRRKESALVGD